MLLQKILQFKTDLLSTPDFKWLLLLFLGIHLVLFNVNQAEWGDSYRIMRAGEILKTGTYPSDEKRPPLLSLVLATRPQIIDPTTYGRIVLLAFSLFSFITFYLLAKDLIIDSFWLTWVSLAYILNNVYLYWSLRIMADVPFSFFVLLALLIFSKWYKYEKISKLFILGIICGLAIITRFEGYILTFAIFAGVFFKDISLKFIPNLKKLWIVLGIALIEIPYLVFRNPFTSSYFEEPGNRTYDINMIAIYLLSLLAATGIPYLFFFYSQIQWSKELLKSQIPLFIFLILELMLILAWPAAVPRLLVPIIPILLIYLALGVKNYFDKPVDSKKLLMIFGLMFFVLTTYALGQYHYKLQFLILDKKLFVFNLLLTSLLIFLIYYKKKIYYLWLSVIIMTLWSYSSIFMHKDIFKSVKTAADYAGKNLTGNVGYNDVSAVSDWYLNYQYKNPDLKGAYYNTEKKAFLEESRLKESGLDYLLITNEHNTTMTLDLQKRPYLSEERIFEYNVNGKNFITRIVKIL